MMSKRKASQTLMDVAEAFGAKLPSKRRRLRMSRLGKKRSGISARSLVPKITKDPFPPEFRTKITWRGPLSISSGANSFVTQYYLNALNDPDATNADGNGVPEYLSQLLSGTGPYTKFRVLGWKAKILLVNVSGTEADGSVIPLEVSMAQGFFSLTDDDTYAEVYSLPGVQTGVLTPNGTTHAVREFNMNGKLKDYVPKGTDDDEDYCGAAATNPAKLLNLAVAVRNPYGAGSANIKCWHKVTIEFDAIFYSRDATTV